MDELGAGVVRDRLAEEVDQREGQEVVRGGDVRVPDGWRSSDLSCLAARRANFANPSPVRRDRRVGAQDQFTMTV
jgi:hypothetical protein